MLAVVQAPGARGEGGGADDGPRPGGAGLHVHGEAEHPDQHQGDAQGGGREHGEAVGGQDEAAGARRPGDAHAGGEELEDQQQQPDDQQQVCDRGAGHRVQEAGQQAELGEPNL